VRLLASGQVRRGGVHDGRAGRPAHRARARAPGVPDGERPRRGRSHDLRGPRGVRGSRRGRSPALLPRALPPDPGRAGLTVPLSRPRRHDETRRAVLAAVDSRRYTLGPQCKELEVELARHAGVRHAVLTSSATAALWMTFKALGVGPGDEILVPSHTAFPTVEAVCFAGGTPVFVDADDWYTLDPKDAAAKVTSRTVGV